MKRQITPDTRLEDVPGIVKRLCPVFSGIGLVTVRDLLLHLPFRYETYGSGGLVEAIPETNVALTLQVTALQNKRSFRKRMTMTEAVLSDGTDEIGAIWFNQPYLVKTLVVGNAYRFAGKVKLSKFGKKLINPQFERVGSLDVVTPAASAANDTSVREVMPVYPLTIGLTQRAVRVSVAKCASVIDLLPDPLPEPLLTEYGLLPLAAALREAHFPTAEGSADRARHRLAFDELLRLQIAVGRMRAYREKATAAPVPFAEDIVKAFVASLPFPLTKDQRVAAWEAMQDMGRNIPMARLLDGDVGTGKTAVAMIAARNVVAAGRQVAVMAPTEILAQQHFGTFARTFASEKNVTIVLWTNAHRRSVRGGKEIEAKGKKEVAALGEEIAKGRVDIIIGTHALVYDALSFHDLAFAVVDEQHRFGVRTRKLLRAKSGDVGTEPHLLSMTATPIPRSLALTAYGDLDLSLLKEKPAARKDIETKLVMPVGRKRAFAFVRGQLDQGRQAFVVCPLIDRSDMVEAASVTELFEKLAKGELKGYTVGMLHGKLSSAEKEEVMRRFVAGETQVLVATSVVEVGVDVPNASVMCIEGAERFGLAQLHQFRGRIGRGAHASYCFLFPTKDTDGEKARLKAVVQHKDGFTLAEKDLELRGPGDLLGDAQSGFPELRFASIADMSLVRTAKEAAQRILAEDPTLAGYPLLAEQVRVAVESAHVE